HELREPHPREPRVHPGGEMTRSLRLATGILASIVLATVAAPASAAPAGLTARVDADGFFGKSERPLVTVTLTNTGLSDVYVVRCQTPLAGVAADLFDVRRDGEPVAYVGRLAKFVAPRPQDYLRIPAGASRSATVDLAQLYDLGRTGEYSVQLRLTMDGALRDAATGARLGDGLAVESNVARMAIERDETLGGFADQLAQATPPAKASNSYVSCSSSRQSSLATARTNAVTYASGALSYLQAHTYSNVGPRYTTWFGAISSSRFSTVTSHYTNLKSALSTASYTFDC